MPIEEGAGDGGAGRILEALRDGGCRPGDTILVHSNTDVLDRLMPEAEPIERFAALKQALLDAVGPEGTVVVPTFNYGFCRGRRFDPARSSSHVGLFTNYMMRQEGAVRSTHPIFSFTAIGRDRAGLMAEVPASAFAEESVFGRLRRRDALIVLFNVPFDNCTFVHHIEQARGVDYRFEKTFRAPVVVDGREQPGEASFYARYLDRGVENNFSRFAARAEQAGVVRRAPLCDAALLCFRAQAIFDFGMRQMAEEPYIFLDRPPAPPPDGARETD